MRWRPRGAESKRPERTDGELVPTLAPAISEGRIVVGQLAIVVTVVGWIAFVATTVSKASGGAPGDPTLGVATLGYLALISLLACSAIAYLTARLGFYYRARAHRRAVRGAIGVALEHEAPSMTVLVPSYREDERVVRMTLLSAALQEYPDLDIVLLIDDPPEPVYAQPAKLLARARRLPGEIEALLAEPGERFAAALARFEERCDDAAATTPADVDAIAVEYEHAVAWLERLAEGYEIVDHADTFLIDQVVGRLAADLRQTAKALRAAAREEAVLDQAHLHHLHRRLDWIFSARLSSFERKRYESLSHEPNKAMNLNSYIGLMGGRYREVESHAGRALIPTDGEADLVVADPDYVLTLDADSVLLPEYCLRMVHELEQSEHARVAVAQTPYNAFPSPATRLERIAGATTDIQHILHQGMTYYDATFWVGANAVLRKRALDQLRETEHYGNFEIHTYIQDRTVIEDTESSIHLGVHGWQLLNYPERLSYSATPRDFGSLTIQRQRWANGGLLILPTLWRQVRTRRRRGDRPRFGETLLRLNYMASICWSSVALVLLLLYQFDGQLLSPLIAVVALPYFAMMASDLRYCGYRRRDVLGIYGFNLVLLPVNLAGVANSLVQGLVGAKASFRRTPKIRGRTAAGFTFVTAPYVFVVFSIATLVLAYYNQRWLNAGFAALNATLATYALVAFIGIRSSLIDAWGNVLTWLYEPTHPARPASAPARAAATTDTGLPAASDPEVDWAAVLRYGDFESVATERGSGARRERRFEPGSGTGRSRPSRVAAGALADD